MLNRVGFNGQPCLTPRRSVRLFGADVTSLNLLRILLGRVWQALIGLPSVNC